MIASDDGLLSGLRDRTGDTMRDHIFYLRMHLAMRDAFLFRLPNDSICNRVRIMLLEAGRDLQGLLRLPGPEAFDPDNLRCRMRERTGLIKDDRIRLRHSLQEFPALHRHVMSTGVADRGKHREWHRQFQRTRKVHHQEGQRAGNITRQKIGDHCTCKAPWHQLIRKMKGLRLGRRFQLLGILDHRDDLIVATIALCLRHTDDAASLLDDSTGIDRCVLCLHNRHGFSGHRGLIHRHLTGYHDTIEWDHIGRSHDDLIPGLKLPDGYQYIRVTGMHPDTIDL